MNAKRGLCFVLCLCLLFAAGFGCVQSAVQTQPSSEAVEQLSPGNDSAVPSDPVDCTPETVDRQDADPVSPAPLYEGEGLKIYYASRLGQPGICVEAWNWNNTYARFQKLPFTEGLTDLVFTGIETKSDGDRAEAFVYLRYLDNTGTERIICADHSTPEYTVVYPLSTEAGLELSEGQREPFDDLLLIGYHYESVYAEANRLSNPDEWESLCQECILGALFYNYGDVLPPYLHGEGTIEKQFGDKGAIVSQKELEDFFQSTVGRPCMIPDGQHADDEDTWKDVPAGTIPILPSDYYCKGHVQQAVMEPDGTICLYGYRSGFEVMYESVICRIRPVDGYLGGQVLSTEIYPVYYMHEDPSITLLSFDQ